MNKTCQLCHVEVRGGDMVFEGGTKEAVEMLIVTNTWKTLKEGERYGNEVKTTHRDYILCTDCLKTLVLSVDLAIYKALAPATKEKPDNEGGK